MAAKAKVGGAAKAPKKIKAAVDIPAPMMMLLEVEDLIDSKFSMEAATTALNAAHARAETRFVRLAELEDLYEGRIAELDEISPEEMEQNVHISRVVDSRETLRLALLAHTGINAGPLNPVPCALEAATEEEYDETAEQFLDHEKVKEARLVDPTTSETYFLKHRVGPFLLGALIVALLSLPAYLK